MTPDQKLFIGYGLAVALLLTLLWLAAVMVRRAGLRPKDDDVARRAWRRHVDKGGER